jgi:protein-arginine kinase activator protein McsA
MKFKCLECGVQEFEVNIKDIINDCLCVIFVCPSCGGQNQVSFISNEDSAQIELIKK